MDEKADYHVHIEGGTSPLTMNLKELWAYRDLTFVVDFGVSLWMYITLVVYPFSRLKDVDIMYHAMLINPMTVPVELFRKILLGQGTIPAVSVILSVVLTVTVRIIVTLTFNSVERSFIDTI